MSGRIEPERILVVAPYIRSSNGHHAPMCLGIVEAARKRGLSADLVVQKDGADPALIARLGAHDLLPPMAIPWALPGDSPWPDFRLSFRLGAMFAEQAHVLDPLLDDRPTLIIVDGLQPATFIGLADWLAAHHGDKTVGVLHMAFAFDLIDLATGKPQANNEVYAALLSAAKHARAEVAVFGRRYRREFEERTGQRAAFYPMPMNLPMIPRAAPGARRPLTIVVNTSVAGAVDAAIACAEHRFVRRHFDPRFKLASWGAVTDDDLRRLNAAGVPLIGRGISPSDYADMFGTQGVLLLAYSAACYRHSTSGVMTEAAAGGLVTVVPADTWMADCIDEGLAAGVAFDALSGPHLVASLRKVHRRWTELNALAAQRADKMRTTHAIEPFLDRAMGSFAQIVGRARSYGMNVGLRQGFEGDSGAQYLTGGWSFAEEWGRWSNGDVASVYLYVLPGDDSLRAIKPRKLYLEIRGLAPADRTQIVDIECNGATIGQCRFEGAATAQIAEFDLPPAAQVPGLHFSFNIRHPVRPRDLGLNDDVRMVGLGLIGLRVTEA